MYDVFPIVWAFDKSYYTMMPMSIRVETKGEFTRGMTVVSGDVPNIEVTTDIRSSGPSHRELIQVPLEHKHS